MVVNKNKYRVAEDSAERLKLGRPVKNWRCFRSVFHHVKCRAYVHNDDDNEAQDARKYLEILGVLNVTEREHDAKRCKHRDAVVVGVRHVLKYFVLAAVKLI